MTDDELRAALLTYVREIEVEGLDATGPYGSRIRALHFIFTRLLALLPPADDAEAVTAEWLKDVGFGPDSVSPPNDPAPWLCITGESHEITRGGRTWMLSEVGDDAGSDVVYLPIPTTRGHVRLLCSALGIPLKESK